MTDQKAKTTWTGFLHTAPYFTAALYPEHSADIPKIAPLPRAILYYDIFDGEVCNGGVMQYFFNQAFRLPDFDKALSYVREHPILEDAIGFMEPVHKSFEKVKDKVILARDKNIWPEELFKDGTFEDLESKFYGVNHDIRMKIYRHILENVDEYMDIIDDENDKNLVFENGFPVGPNSLDRRKGRYVYWFTPDRLHLEIDKPGWDAGERQRNWVDYRTGMSAERFFKEGKLEHFQTRKSMWYNHGLDEWYDEDGACSSTALYLDEEEILTRYEDIEFSNWVRKKIYTSKL